MPVNWQEKVRASTKKKAQLLRRKCLKNPKKVIIDGDVGIHESVFNHEQILYLETRCIFLISYMFI